MAYRAPERQPGICPGCNRNLRPRTIAGLTWETCPTCEGHWIDDNTLADLCREMRVDADPPALEPRPPVAARACPTCRAPMREVALMARDQPAVALDRCDAHGVWFDRRELEVTLCSATFDTTTLSWGALFRMLLGTTGTSRE